MNEEEKLKVAQQIQLGKLCEDWMSQVGEEFFKKEKKKVLNDLATALPSELIAVQARYLAVVNLMDKVKFIINKKNRTYKKMTKERG